MCAVLSLSAMILEPATMAPDDVGATEQLLLVPTQ
jgi:hypothetical protein